MTDDPLPRPRPRPLPRPRPDLAAPDSSPRRWWPLVIVVVVLAALVAANIVLAVRRSGNDDVEQARSHAVAAAKEHVPVLLSYDYTSMDAYAKRAVGVTTGTFRQDYAKLLANYIEPAAVQQQTHTRATVKTVGVISAHADRVVLIVLLDQTTSGKGAVTSRVDGSRSKVTMRRAGGKWLIADFVPI
ncbi:MAG: hypothetical protein M3Y06_12025 [Actinomycetota bacterium]|nr:hypothetical protein [Actinomycetota bacterium]